MRRLRGRFGRRTRPATFPPLREPSSSATHPVTVATILDDFSYQCFHPEARLVELDPAIWRSQLEQQPPDLILVESAWEGNQGRWRYSIAHWSKFDPHPLSGVLHWARANGVPSVFWNKEDPANFEVFIDAASNFDWVFTTADEMVPRYEQRLGHNRVATMPFAAQPRLHQPIEMSGEAVDHRRHRLAFAGSWRGRKYPDRAAAIGRLLGPVADRGQLDIYDRLEGSADAFPERYTSAVVGSLPPAEMSQAYRHYGGFLNVDSVTNSTSMMSRRVFEILASGVPILSEQNSAYDSLLPGLVTTARSERDVIEFIAYSAGHSAERTEHVKRAVRVVHGRHSYRHRIVELLEHVGLSQLAAEPERVFLTNASGQVLDDDSAKHVQSSQLDVDGKTLDKSIWASADDWPPRLGDLVRIAPSVESLDPFWCIDEVFSRRAATKSTS